MPRRQNLRKNTGVIVRADRKTVIDPANLTAEERMEKDWL